MNISCQGTVQCEVMIRPSVLREEPSKHDNGMSERPFQKATIEVTIRTSQNLRGFLPRLAFLLEWSRSRMGAVLAGESANFKWPVTFGFTSYPDQTASAREVVLKIMNGMPR